VLSDFSKKSHKKLVFLTTSAVNGLSQLTKGDKPMGYRNKMSKSSSKSSFKKNATPKKINNANSPGMRGGIRL